MRRCNSEGFVSEKSNSDGVHLILDDQNVHLGNLLRNQMNKTTTQYTFHLENETIINMLTKKAKRFRYYPNLGGLAFIHNSAIKMLHLTTQSISTLIEDPQKEFDQLLSDNDSNDDSDDDSDIDDSGTDGSNDGSDNDSDTDDSNDGSDEGSDNDSGTDDSDDDSIVAIISDFEIVEKDQTIFYLICRGRKYLLQYHVEKVDMTSGKLIWKCNVPVGQDTDFSCLAYHQQLDILFIGVDKIYRMDGSNGKLLKSIELLGDIFIDAVGKVYITSNSIDVTVYLLKEDALNVEREMIFQLVKITYDCSYGKIVQMVDDRFIITNLGDIYDWNHGGYLGKLELAGIGTIIVNGGRVFKYDGKSCISYDLRIEKEMIDCPLGKSEREMIERLGGIIPKYHLTNQGILSVFFLHTRWNQQYKYMLDDHRLDFIQIITFQKNTINDYCTSNYLMLHKEEVLIGRDETVWIYFNTKTSTIKIRMGLFEDKFELSLLDFLFRMKRIDVEYVENHVACIDYSKIVNDVPPQYLSNDSYYKSLTIGNLLTGEPKEVILKLLERLGMEKVIVNSQQYLKADLLMAYLCNISTSLISSHFRVSKIRPEPSLRFVGYE